MLVLFLCLYVFPVFHVSVSILHLYECHTTCFWGFLIARPVCSVSSFAFPSSHYVWFVPVVFPPVPPSSLSSLCILVLSFPLLVFASLTIKPPQCCVLFFHALSIFDSSLSLFSSLVFVFLVSSSVFSCVSSVWSSQQIKQLF